MDKNREKAVALVGGQTVKDLEHAFDYWTDVRMRFRSQASDHWYPFDFFHHFLQEQENIPGEICQSYYKLNAEGIELSECLTFGWNECEPTDMEEC